MTTATAESPKVLPQQLRAARQSLALSIEDVSTQLRVDPGTVIAWEEGRSQPSLDALWALAELYARPTEYFLVETPPKPADMNFRLARGHSLSDLSLETRRALVQFEEICRAASQLSDLAGMPKHSPIPRQPQERSPLSLANSERHRLGLDSSPVRNLRQLLSERGIWVFELLATPGEFLGFSWWHRAYGPCILLNARDNPGRRAFTLAHEYGHLVHSTGTNTNICDLTREQDFAEERFASRFAAAFLMPESDVKNEFERRTISSVQPDKRQVQNLSKRYGVSFEAFVRRLDELELLANNVADALLLAGVREFRGSASGPRWRRRLGERYVVSAFRAYELGNISLGKLAACLQTDIRNIKDELAKSKVIPSGRRG